MTSHLAAQTLDRRDLMRNAVLYPCALALLGSPAATAETTVPAGGSLGPQLWRDYHASLGRLSALLSHPDTPQDPMVIATGLTNLQRISQLAWELAFEFNDHDSPKFFPVSIRNLSHGWNSSNARYHVAVIDGARNYRLVGSRGAAPFVEIGVYDNLDGFSIPGEGGGRRLAAIDENELRPSDSGKIAVGIGPDRRAEPWLPTTKGEKVIFIRQYAFDWKETPWSNDFVVEPVDPFPSPANYPGKLESALNRAPKYVENHLNLYHGIVTRSRRSGKNIMLDVPRDTVATLPKGHHYASGNFELRDGEVLMIEFAPQPAPYWSLELGDFWGQTLDFDRTLDDLSNVPYDMPATQSHLHNRQIELDKDGQARIHISPGPRPEGAVNWLDTRNNRIGFIVYRQFRQADLIPKFTTRVLKR